MANNPTDIMYTETHEWVKEDGEGVVIGISDFAQSELGDIVYINLPESGTKVNAKETFADVESVKAVSDIYSPVTGEVYEVNDELINNPALVNEDPYGAWFIKVRNITEKEELISADKYEQFCKKE